MSGQDEPCSGVRFAELLLCFDFRYTEDKKYTDAKCKGCQKVIPKYKVDRVIDHVKKCNKLNQVNVKKILDAYKARLDASSSRKEKLIDVNSEKRHQELDMKVVNLVAMESLPILIIKSKSFIDLFSAIDPSYKLPGLKKFTRRLLPKQAEMTNQQLLKEIEKEDLFTLTLEFDGVTTMNGLSLLAILITTRSGQSVFLELVDIGSEIHTASNIAETVFRVFKESKLSEESINSIISDEAANCKKARKLIIEMFTSKHVLEYRCLAHVVNLIGCTMCKSAPLNLILQKLTTLVLCVNRHKRLMNALADLGANKIVNSVPTRWYSTYSLINSDPKLKDLFPKLPKNGDLSSKIWLPIV